MSGRFITFEGIDGAGKSTHLPEVAQRLRSRGIEVVVTREPGGTALAEAVRGWVLHQPMDVLTEALLVFAARRDHLQSVIRPALERRAVVLCDRFTDASFAYQGAGRGLGGPVLEFLQAWVQEGLQPDLTLWFDLPPRLAAERRAAARDADRFEREELDFFERVRAGYAARAQAEPGRFVRIDSTADRAAVASAVDAALSARGW